MKRLVITLLACFVALSVAAQGRISYSLEFSGGVGFGRGPLFTVAPDFVAQYDLGEMVKAGVGVGARYSMPCETYKNTNGSHERRFCYELDIPVFARLSWGGEKFYSNLDAGYNVVNVFTTMGTYWVPTGDIDPIYDGLFIEPQACWRISRKSMLAIGLLFQQGNIRDTFSKPYSDGGGFSSTQSHENELFPAITLRYGYCF